MDQLDVIFDIMVSVIKLEVEMKELTCYSYMSSQQINQAKGTLFSLCRVL